jgi:acyl carrier protein
VSNISFEEAIDKIKKILVKNSDINNIKLEDIYDETPVFGHGGVITDSLNILDALTQIESEFDFEIPDEDLTENLFVSIGTLAKYIYKNGVIKEG